MNVRLYDGSARCTDHMDSSSYEGLTTDACAYCKPKAIEDCPVLEEQCAMTSKPTLIVRPNVTVGGWEVIDSKGERRGLTITEQGAQAIRRGIIRRMKANA